MAKKRIFKLIMRYEHYTLTISVIINNLFNHCNKCTNIVCETFNLYTKGY